MNKTQVEEFLSQSHIFFRSIQTAGDLKAEVFEKLSYGLETFALKNGADKKGVPAMIAELKELTQQGWREYYIEGALDVIAKYTRVPLDAEICGLIAHRYLSNFRDLCQAIS